MSKDFEPTQIDPKSALYAKFLAFFSDIPGTTDRFGDHEKSLDHSYQKFLH